ncbi:lipoprotein [Streptomyces deserti]
MHRTALAALCLATAATAGLTGCLPGEDKADSKPSASRQAGQNDTNGRSGQSGTPTETKKKEPFAGLTGGEIAERAVKATTGASSLRTKGDIPDDETGGTIRIDMALNRKGECAGTMSVDGEGEAELIKTGDTVYMKYDEAFLRAQSEGEPKADTDAAVALLAGKWTRMSAKGADAKDLASFCDLDSVLGGAEDGDSDATRGKTTTVDGTPAIVLHEKDGKERYTLYVATEGEPYLLRFDSLTPGDQGSLILSDYNEPVPTQKPSGEVLDLDALGG